MKSHSGIHCQCQAEVSSLHYDTIIIESLRLKKLSAQKQVTDKNATAAHYENLEDCDDRTENQEKKLALERSYRDSYLYLMNMKTPFCGGKKKNMECSFNSSFFQANKRQSWERKPRNQTSAITPCHVILFRNSI